VGISRFGGAEMTKKIIAACGGGIATSTIIVCKLRNVLAEKNIEAEIIQCKVSEIDLHLDDADLIVSSANLEKEYEVPALHVISFLTGVDVEKTIDDILAILVV